MSLSAFLCFIGIWLLVAALVDFFHFKILNLFYINYVILRSKKESNGWFSYEDNNSTLLIHSLICLIILPSSLSFTFICFLMYFNGIYIALLNAHASVSISNLTHIRVKKRKHALRCIYNLTPTTSRLLV